MSHLLRRTYRDGGKVQHETLANLSALPEPAIEAVRASLAGKTLLVAGEGLEVPRGRCRTGTSPRCGPPRDARAARPAGPGRAGPGPGAGVDHLPGGAPGLEAGHHPTWWADTTLGVDLGVADASTDEVYAAMDWLLARQDAIEAKLAARHLAPAANPSRMALFDLSSSWMEGRHCPLAARGYSRDGKKGCTQIEYGLLTDPAGRPVAVRVFAGNTADPTAFIDAVEVVRTKFGLTELVMVGDRGMITAARIDALRAAAWAG